MPKPFKISINQPCNQKWTDMEEVIDDGRFCNSCAKTVVDFTKFSDLDLKNWFNQQNKNVCGKLNASQLDRFINPKPIFSIKWFKPSLFGASLFAFLSIPKLSSATVKIKHPIFQGTKTLKQMSLEQPKKVADSIVTVKGRVIDNDDKQPLVSFIIVVKGTKKSVSTDSKGNFELQLNRNQFPKKVVLEFKYLGYESREIKIDLDKTNPLYINMKASQAMLGGLGIIKEKTTFEKIRAIFNA